MIKLHAIGGYSEVGKNMTALQINDDVILIDSGLFLPPIVELEEREKFYTEKKLRSIGALPDDLLLDKLNLSAKVRALLVSHAHLDHVGALPYIAPRYKAEIAATPFTLEVLKALLKDNNIRIKNHIRKVTPNSSFNVKGNKEYKVEFINITHSTPQTALIAIHTPKGVVLYANDFKFDNFPMIGKKPNYKRLQEIGKEGVLALIVESLYAGQEGKTPSEKIAQNLLEDVLTATDNKDACIIVTTFSSHIARLKSIVHFGKQLGRKIVFLGRSLRKYVTAATRLKLAPFVRDIELLSYKNEVERALKIIAKKRNRYMIVCTGHQGEPGSVLDRLARGMLPFTLQREDHVIFSSCIIPTPISIANRKRLEKKLKEKGIRIFADVHVSGHAFREDLRDLIKVLNPQHIIPAHGEMSKLTALAELGTEQGYKLGKNLHIMQDGQTLQL